MRISDWSSDVCSSDLSTSYLKRKATSSLDFSDFANVLTGLTTVSQLLDRFTTDNFIQEVRLSSSAAHTFNWPVRGFFEDSELNLAEQISQQCAAGTPSPSGGSFRSDERRVGESWVSTERSRCTPCHQKHTNTHTDISTT